jgi:hypothetical protein
VCTVRRIQHRALQAYDSLARTPSTWHLGPRLRHRWPCDRSRSCCCCCCSSVPGTVLFASLARFDPPRVYRHAAARRCIRLDISKAKPGSQVPYGVQVQPSNLDWGELYTGSAMLRRECRLLPVGSGSSCALSRLSSQVSTFG